LVPERASCAFSERGNRQLMIIIPREQILIRLTFVFIVWVQVIAGNFVCIWRLWCLGSDPRSF